MSLSGLKGCFWWLGGSSVKVEERFNGVGGHSGEVVEDLEFLVEMRSQVFVVDRGVCRRFRAEVRDGLRWWTFREWDGRVWEVVAGYLSGIFRWKGVLGVREEAGCLGLVSEFWKHEEGGGDSGHLGTVLGSGMQVFGELEGGWVAREEIWNFWKKRKKGSGLL